MDGDHRTKRIVVAVDESILVLLYVKPPTPPIYSFFDAASYLLSGDATAEVQKLGTRMVRSIMERAESVCSDFNHKESVERYVTTGDAREVVTHKSI